MGCSFLPRTSLGRVPVVGPSTAGRRIDEWGFLGPRVAARRGWTRATGLRPAPRGRTARLGSVDLGRGVHRSRRSTDGTPAAGTAVFCYDLGSGEGSLPCRWPPAQVPSLPGITRGPLPRPWSAGRARSRDRAAPGLPCRDRPGGGPLDVRAASSLPCRPAGPRGGLRQGDTCDECDRGGRLSGCAPALARQCRGHVPCAVDGSDGDARRTRGCGRARA
jgi:hypothetical protein